MKKIVDRHVEELSELLITQLAGEELAGQTFEVARRYGHSKEIIRGGRNAWVGDTHLMRHILGADGAWENIGNMVPHGHPPILTLAVEKLGGYDGPPNPNRTLEQLLEPYRAAILEVRQRR